MNSPIKRASHACVIAVAACACATPAHSQQYPVKPVRVIIPSTSGGAIDITARQFSAKLSEYLGQQFLVDNRGGAGGLIGMELTARALADGYTIMTTSMSFAAVSASQKPAFDPINSIIPVAEFGYTAGVVTIHPSLPASTIKELIGLARTTKGGLSYAAAGTGSASHLDMEILSRMAKIKMVAIQYKGGGAAMAGFLSGEVPVVIGSLLSAKPHVSAGKARALAVTTARRWHTLPEVPTVAETLPGFEAEPWFGTMAPRGTPPAIIERLNAGINKALQDPAIKTHLEREGMMARGGTPQQFGERIRKDYDRWVKVVREANIKPGQD